MGEFVVDGGAKTLAEWFCRDDETWHHHDRTDNFPCTRCWEKASRAIASGVVQPREDAVREAQAEAYREGYGAALSKPEIDKVREKARDEGYRAAALARPTNDGTPGGAS